MVIFTERTAKIIFPKAAWELHGVGGHNFYEVMELPLLKVIKTDITEPKQKFER